MSSRLREIRTKLVNGYGKITQPIADSFGRNMIGCSNGPDRQSHTVMLRDVT